MITVNLNEARLSILMCQAAGLIPNLVGCPGSGKTSVTNWLAEKWGAVDLKEFDADSGTKWYHVLPLACMEATDIVGLPNLKDGVTEFFPPSWLVSAARSPGVLFIDEFDRSAPEVQNAVMRAIHTKELGGIKLHKETVIVCAMNGDTDIYCTPLSEANRQRFVNLYVLPSDEEWFKYMTPRYDAAILLGARSKKSPKWQPTDMCSDFQCLNRAYDFASALVVASRQYAKVPGAWRTTQAVVQGVIGAANAATFLVPELIDRDLRAFGLSIAMLETDPRNAPVPAKADEQAAVSKLIESLSVAYSNANLPDNARLLQLYAKRLKKDMDAATMA